MQFDNIEKTRLPKSVSENDVRHPHSAPSESTIVATEKQRSDRDDREASHESRLNVEILQLARRYTTQSQHQGPLFPLPAEGPLNPDSADFNAKKWAKAFYNLRNDVADGTPPRTAGIAFRDLSVYGFGTSTDYQKSVANVIFGGIGLIRKILLGRQKGQRIDILHNLEGVVRSGEMLCVLGPPGSGCSTLLRTIAGDTHGFYVSDDSTINYEGIHPKQMSSTFRGEAIYAAEVDAHFPHLTVGDTLYLAARARCPKALPDGVSRYEYAEHLRDVTMAMFGISHTKNTRVGDDFIRGVSGGERKRVTISEAALSYSPLQCWDNSTRGLDSANALEFCRTLRTQADILGSTACVAIYQASQDAYDVFDKVIVLYEGRQIFFGKTSEAKAYFENLGFVCPERQTTADFLTSMSSHQERIVHPDYQGKAPRSPDEFAEAWKMSPHRALLHKEIDDYQEHHPFNGKHYERFLASRRLDQSGSQRSNSPFTLSYIEQVKLTLWRSWVMLKGDPSMTLTMLITNIFQALIMSSIFYNLPLDSTSISRRGILVFFIVLSNAFGSILEIMTLYAKRAIVEKHNRYALYHPSAEALSAIIVDLPYKLVNSVFTSLVLYFLPNLRREPGPFFFFYLVILIMTLAMSMLFRLMGSLTKSIAQALAPASVILLVIALYTGFAIKVQYMQNWLGWLRWINPVHYGFESALLNEFVGQTFRCVSYVPAGPGYESVEPDQRVCTVSGAVPGEDFVDGSAYIETSYGYRNSHRWRNVGIMILFMFFFMICHLVAAEYVAAERSKGEVLVFTRAAINRRRRQGQRDIENVVDDRARRAAEDSCEVTDIAKSTSVFHWRDVCYDIKIQDENRRILDRVDGWVKPGTLTALMGVSGAGKTTLLDVLASRVTVGVITGDMLVDGNPRDASFQRKTGYVQQQDLHLHTSTVREALHFSALLRQPSYFTRKEKLDYVDTVIDLLDMQEYSEAIIGVPGEGLNVEQRKRLTIGVELAARPQLLLFLDEPTSGLDSQTSWSICNLMEKLANNGQAILCTIHQPSAILFQRFDRLLLLAKGGKTVYFGQIGKNSHCLIDYFIRNGGPICPPESNPAEYMLQVIGAAPGAHTDIDWPAVWRQSPEYQRVRDELTRLSAGPSPRTQQVDDPGPTSLTEFAAPFGLQFREVAWRVFQQYWRSPSYLYSKAFLSCGAALFIGLSFLNIENTQGGLQNQMFGVFIFLTVFSQLVDQILPVFVSQRTMYEARERPSKAYSWVAFLGANMLAEAAWNSIMSVFSFILWYFPIGLYRNARQSGAEHSRGATSFLFVWVFFIFASSFAHLIIAGLETYDVAGAIVGLLTIMMFAFCGVLAGPDTMPGFWIFMYRVNPFTYFVEGFLGTALANADASCASNEFVVFNAPKGTTCAEYMQSYIDTAGGFLDNPDASEQCRYCPISETNTFLAGVNIDFSNRWRNFGIMWAFVVFNLIAATWLYWLARVPKKSKVKKN